MKVVALLLVALCVVASSLARPAEPDVTSDLENVHVNSPHEVSVQEELPHEEAVEAEVRNRRSPKDRGSVGVDVQREKGVGTIVSAKGEGNIWTSRNGNTRLDAQGQWSKVVNGPGRGKPNYGGGISFTHRF